MKQHIKLYEEYTSNSNDVFFTTEKEIKDWIKKHMLKKTKISPFLEVSFGGSLNFGGLSIGGYLPEDFPVFIGEVKENVDLGYQKNIVSLKRGPKKVGGNYWIGDNRRLKDLGGRTEYVGDFIL